MIQLRPCQKRGISAMIRHSIGQLIMPTGAGKTICMIYDAKRIFEESDNKTVVVVAPRILLAEQLSAEFLEHITNAHVMHVHSGETHHYSSTNPSKIFAWNYHIKGNKLIFTTYNSLHKIQESDIQVDTIYFDEAHNSVKKSFYPKAEYFAENANRCYYFTATPKHSHTYKKPGMNETRVYGQVICNVPAPELVETGAIIPPKINVQQINAVRDKEFGAERDCMTLLDTILNEDNMQKVLVAAPNTKVLMRMLAETDFMTEMK